MISSLTEMTTQNIVLLGATGSIGSSTLSVVREHPDRFRVAALAAFGKVDEFSRLALEFPQARLCLFDPVAAAEASRQVGRRVASGMDGLLELVSLPEADTLVNGLVGSIGCRPTMEAIRRGMRVCLANKETLVMAGELIETLLRQHPGASLHPIDSEHSALYQAIAGRPVEEVESLVLTASGGPFRELAPELFASITVEQALKHPTWTMGPKITIDSSTLFNKGLEVIEAHFLFRVPYERIEVLVHPGSHVHSFVQFRDGALMAQLGTPDMRLPILYSLVAPERVSLTGPRLDLASLGTLRFEKPDHARFPALGLAYRAGKAGGIHPAVLNAANEAAVALFLDRNLSYTGISRLVEAVLDETESVSAPDFDQLLAADAWARRRVQELSRAEVPA